MRMACASLYHIGRVVLIRIVLILNEAFHFELS